MCASLGIGGLSCTPVAPGLSGRPPNKTPRGTVAIMGTAAARNTASPYEVLRVSEKASAAEIKAAYRALAKRFHPDVDPAGGGSEFMEIQRAYAILSNRESRAQYDSSVRRVGCTGSSGFRTRRWETDQCW